jgi:hypothetical protein
MLYDRPRSIGADTSTFLIIVKAANHNATKAPIKRQSPLTIPFEDERPERQKDLDV